MQVAYTSLYAMGKISVTVYLLAFLSFTTLSEVFTNEKSEEDNGFKQIVPKFEPYGLTAKGEVWPKPQHQNKNEKYFILRGSTFSFNVISHNCSILIEALSRYNAIIMDFYKFTRMSQRRGLPQLWRNNPQLIGYLYSLDVELLNNCCDDEYPFLEMDEKYNLTIAKSILGTSTLTANTVWGILRGLETFSQLIYVSADETNLLINATSISDFPRFPHRGIMLDTSRHYLSKTVILMNLEAMSYNKFNVFHWHIVDDESFPYQSISFPGLSEGAYDPIEKIYSPDDVREIIEYGRLRGIRVIPEFNTPGHTRSWGENIPEILTVCYNDGSPTAQLGPMDPSQKFLFSILNKLYEEISITFQDRYVHLGGDEVDYDCWKSNPNINLFMEFKNMSGDYIALVRYHMEQLLDIVTPKKLNSIVWEEVFLADTKTPNSIIIQVWKGGYSSLREITASGTRAIFSSCWQLDDLASGGDWEKFYNCDPGNFAGNESQLKLILGGEACMWGENVNEYNVLQRVWPRACAAAEKLWSAYKANEYEEAIHRLEEHTCRMNTRHIPAQPPNGPGCCN